MDNKIDIFVAIVGAAVTPLIGGVTPLMITLLYIMVFDMVSGILCGISGVSHKSQTGRLNSSVMFEGIVKKAAVFVVVGVGYQLERATGIGAVRDGVVLMYICEEGLSCIENIGLLGVPIPDAIKRAIDILKGDKGG